MDAFKRYYWDEQLREYTDSGGDECTCAAVVSDEANARIAAMEAAAKDCRYLIAAFLKTVGGRLELSQSVVMSIGSKDQISTWDDPISGKKVYVLTEITSTAETGGGVKA